MLCDLALAISTVRNLNFILVFSFSVLYLGFSLLSISSTKLTLVKLVETARHPSASRTSCFIVRHGLTPIFEKIGEHLLIFPSLFFLSSFFRLLF